MSSFSKIEWKEQNLNFGLDYSTKTGKWEDYHFDIRYDYEGNPKEKPEKCILHLCVSKSGQIIHRKASYKIESLVLESILYMRDEQIKFMKAIFSETDC